MQKLVKILQPRACCVQNGYLLFVTKAAIDMAHNKDPLERTHLALHVDVIFYVYTNLH